MPMSTLALATDIASLKSRLRGTWMAGDYDHFSRYLEKDARSFYESLDVPPGAHLLDVACGSGQLALIAAREGVRVTGVDIAENLIERVQARSMAEGIPGRFRVADAESLPFPDASFDVVVSLIGAMFSPRPHLVARELTRVCVPGGTIAMANWTAGGGLWERCSTPSQSSFLRGCLHHSNGAMRPSCENDSVRRSANYGLCEDTTLSTTRSHLPRS
jgi:SAM-dependent methyltransferase